MRFSRTFEALAHKLEVRRLGKARSARSNELLPDDEEVSAEEMEDLESLLRDVSVKHEPLGREHWVKQAAMFRERIEAETARAEAQRDGRLARYARYKRVATGAVPLGGLFALVALVALRTPVFHPDSYHGTDEVVTWWAAPEATRGSQGEEGVLSEAYPGTTLSAYTQDVRVQAPVNGGSAVLLSSRAGLMAAERELAAAKHSLAAVHSSTARSHARGPAQLGTDDEITVTVDRRRKQVDIPPQEPARAASSRTEAGRSSAVDTPDDTFAEQLAALKRANQALKLRKFAAARAALAREFSPQLLPHALALRVFLDCQGGHLARGRTALSKQEISLPNSPYLARMRSACGLNGDED